MSMIAEGEAHLSTFDGVDMFQANTELGLTPLLFENYGQGVGTSYYAVAAVKKVNICLNLCKCCPEHWCLPSHFAYM